MMQPASASDEDRERRLDAAIAAWLKAAETPGKRDPQIWLKRYPDLAGELSEFFAGDAELARLASPLRDVLRLAAPDAPAGANSPTLAIDLNAKTQDWAAPHTLLPIGDARRAFGEYELLAEIARGGMGVVYKARQTRLNRTVAIKMILAGELADRDDVRRFLVEAEAAAGLDHPGIVPVYECGQIEGRHFFSMGFVDGQSLSALLAGGPLPPNQAAELLLRVTEAVAYAHGQGVIHRDLKPGNILLDRDGHPRVTDFGLAKKVTGDSGLTHSGQALGTPSYMPPEQAAGKLAEIGPRSDVYALGAVLYAMLVGRPPFQAASPLDTLLQVLEQEPVAPRKLNPRLPIDLETIALKCLQKEPRKRYATADELVEELRRFLHGEPILARPIGRAQRAWRWCRRNPAVAGLAASAAIALLAGAGVSTFFAVVANRRADDAALSAAAARRAEQAAQVDLRESYLAQARAQRVSGTAGQRFESLKALSAAAALPGGAKVRAELRDEAIACLALMDLRPERRWPGFSSGTTALALDRSFERYARSDGNGMVQVRSVADDRLLYELPSPGAGQHAWILGFSPDGRYLAAVHHPNTLMRVWLLDTKSPAAAKGRLVLSLSIGRSFEFHHDGRRLAFDQANGAVIIRDLPAGHVVALFAPSVKSRAFAFHPDGAQIAIAAARPPSVGLFDLETQQHRRTLLVGESNSPGAPTRLAWSSNGRLLAVACDDNQVYVCDATTGHLQTVLRGHQGKPTDAVFNSAGDLLATSGWDGVVRFWDPFSGKQLLVQEGAVGYQSLAFSDDDRLFGPTVSGSEVTLWRVATGSEACASLCRPFGEAVNGVAFSRDGRLLATVDAGSQVHLWSVAGREYLATLPGNVASIAFDPAGDSLLTAGAAGLHRWPIREDSLAQASGREEKRLHVGPPESLGLPGGLSCVSLDASGRTIAVAAPGGQAVILREDGAKVALERPVPNLLRVALSSDGHWLATGTRFTFTQSGLKVWNAVTGKLKWEFAEGRSLGDCFSCFSDDGKWLATSFAARKIQCWKVGSWGAGYAALGANLSGLTMPAFHPRAETLALVASRDRVEFVDPAGGQRLANLLALGPRAIAGVTFGPFGQRLAVRRGELVQLWDLDYLRRELKALRFDGSGLGPSAVPKAPPLPTTVVIEDGNGIGAVWDATRRPRPLGPREVYDAAAARLKPAWIMPGWKSSWAPDGQRIVLTAGPPPKPGLLLVDVASGKSSPLVAPGKDPAFRPTGDLIAFVRGDGAAEEIWLIAPDGSQERKAADGGFPGWSGDGKTLYFHSRRDWQVKALEVDSPDAQTSDVLRVSESWYPAASPDGRKVAYLKPGLLKIVDRDGGKTIEFSLPGAKGGLAGWSPDSRRVAYGGYGSGDNAGLWVLEIETGRTKRILAGPFTMPAWSSDGARLAFDFRPGDGPNRVWVVEAKAFDLFAPGK